MSVRTMVVWIGRIVLLLVLYAVAFMAGSSALAGQMPSRVGDPGLVSDMTAVGILVVANTGLISALILASRWHGWRLALALGLAYYGAVTVLMQIETWYFLSRTTVSPTALTGLFVMGVPVAFGFIPLAVWVLGRWSRPAPGGAGGRLGELPPGDWAWKLPVLALVYVVLYWCAGYFIAWQNPELRAFYGQPGPALPFWAYTGRTLAGDPWLFPFQLLRGLIWVACAWPIIRGSRLGAGWTAVLVGLLFSLPQNLAHIMANPFMPVASVRLSHLVETATSTFLFGLIVTWWVHGPHSSWRDLLGLRRVAAARPPASVGRPS